MIYLSKILNVLIKKLRNSFKNNTKKILYLQGKVKGKKIKSKNQV